MDVVVREILLENVYGRECSPTTVEGFTPLLYKPPYCIALQGWT